MVESAMAARLVNVDRDTLLLLIYCYATGVFGSRQIERGTYENVAVRVLCGDTHPDHDTICAFRRLHRLTVARMAQDAKN